MLYNVVNKMNSLMCCRMLYFRTCYMAEVFGCPAVRL